MNIGYPSPSHIPCPKDFSHHLTKYEFKKTSKISISQLFSESGKIWKHSLIFKNPLINWEKVGNWDVQPKRYIQQFQFWIYG